MRREYLEVDVFTDRPYRGNPLGVVAGAEGLSSDDMQHFANWTNFSETTYLLPPTDPKADYCVRIFTPTTELPFAGHPTLGSCHAWLSTGGVPRDSNLVVQECSIGLVSLRRGENDRFAFAAPPLLRSGPLDDSTLQQTVETLDVKRDAIIDAAWIDNGPGWLGVLLGSAEEVLAIKPTPTQLKIGVIGPYPGESPFAYEVRAFFGAGDATFEDPVTGSLNASAAQWLIGAGRFTPPYVASQGTALGRAGRVYVGKDGDQVWIGGGVTTCVTGFVEL